MCLLVLLQYSNCIKVLFYILKPVCCLFLIKPYLFKTHSRSVSIQFLFQNDRFGATFGWPPNTTIITAYIKPLFPRKIFPKKKLKQVENMFWNLFLVLSLANASILRTQDRLVFFWLRATFSPTLQNCGRIGSKIVSSLIFGSNSDILTIFFQYL